MTAYRVPRIVYSLKPCRRNRIRLMAIASLVLPVAALALILLDSTGSSGGKAVPAATAALPPDTRYRSLTADLIRQSPDARLASITVSGAEGKVIVRRAAPGQGFPAGYVNPLGMRVVSGVLAGHDGVRLTSVKLAPGPSGRLRWRLDGRRNGRPWVASVAANGTGLTVRRTG